MTRVKICGVTREEDFRAVEAAGADAVGVVASVGVDTPREVSVERAASLVGEAPPFLSTVLVSMPADAAAAVELVEAVGPDVLQVHGDHDLSFFRQTGDAVDAALVAAVGSDEHDRARRVASAVGAVLVDSTTESGAGGTGTTHDWARTRRLAADLDAPVILAGGLAPENVADAVRAVGPHAVDVASGVERAGGVKDHAAVSAFVRNARGVEVAP